MKLHWRQAVLCVVGASLLAAPAFAVDERQKKAAVAMAEQGARAFQSGDMAKAAAQYLLASRTDPDEPNYLYGAVHTTVSRQDALARANSSASHQTIGAIVGGAGLAAVGVGVWLWLRAPDKATHSSSGGTIVPTGNGVA